MQPSISESALRELDPVELGKLETPCFVFDPAMVIEDYGFLKEQLGTPLIVSLKASPVLDLLVRCGHAFTDGIEIASLGELNLTVGRMAVPRYVNTPALDSTLIASALACRATLTADNPYQVNLIQEAAKNARGPVRLVLRLNAASLLGDRIRAGDHFGMDLETIWRVFNEAADTNLKIVGLHVFAGSNSFGEYAGAIADGMAALVSDLQGQSGVQLEIVNLGGGIPADWRHVDIDFASYRKKLARLQRHVTVLHETGRAVFSRSGLFATRVMGVKKLNGQRVVVCDGGMAHCFALAQTEAFLKRPRIPAMVRMSTSAEERQPDTTPISVVGNSCNKADIIGRIEGECPLIGDMLVFDHCGAYHTYSPTGFLNLRPAQRYIVS